MAPIANPEQILELYRTLSDEQRRRALACLIHRVTIDARDNLLDNRSELAWQCNETIHRVSGFIARGDLATESFISALIQDRRWTRELEAALKSAAG